MSCFLSLFFIFLTLSVAYSWYLIVCANMLLQISYGSATWNENATWHTNPRVTINMYNIFMALYELKWLFYHASILIHKANTKQPSWNQQSECQIHIQIQMNSYFEQSRRISAKFQCRCVVENKFEMVAYNTKGKQIVPLETLSCVQLHGAN